jgi:hypothetical protein
MLVTGNVVNGSNVLGTKNILGDALLQSMGTF